jgi:hypothetical protein
MLRWTGSVRWNVMDKGKMVKDKCDIAYHFDMT